LNNDDNDDDSNNNKKNINTFILKLDSTGPGRELVEVFMNMIMVLQFPIDHLGYYQLLKKDNSLVEIKI
jgi:hypothetical protein